MNVLKGKWICYACGAHGTTTDVVEGDDNRFGRDIEELLDETLRVYPESWLDQFGTSGYWLSRFSEDACTYFKLRQDTDIKMPCYPMRGPSGEVWGVVYRNTSEEGAKYLYPYGPKKSHTLFNYSPMQRDVVILCEGAADAIACWDAGYEAFGIYGSAMSTKQYQLMNRVGARKVVLLFDNDSAGELATERVGNNLVEVGYDVEVPDWPSGVKDIGDLDVQLRGTFLRSLAS